MNVIVKTMSGSHYFFQKNGNELRVVRNFTKEGIVEGGKIEIEMGKPMEIKAYMLNAYDYHQEEDITCTTTTPVVKIRIC